MNTACLGLGMLLAQVGLTAQPLIATSGAAATLLLMLLLMLLLALLIATDSY
jgi:hypothetical protein